MNNKIKRKVGLWIIKLAVCILFFSAGYLFNSRTGKYEYSYHTYPTVPKLPKNAPAIFREYKFYDLNIAGAERNQLLYNFYDAWQNEETYGFYEIGYGLDYLTHLYWLTEKGKAFYLAIMDHGDISSNDDWHIEELKNVSFYQTKYINEKFTRVPIDPNTLNDQSVYIDNSQRENK